MFHIQRTNSSDNNFTELTAMLDYELQERNGKIQLQYNGHNKIESVDTVVVAFSDAQPVGCGCFKIYDKDTIEIKRMFVLPEFRGQGVSKIILNELEKWANELDFSFAILETGKKHIEAIGLYFHTGYSLIENYGQYKNIANSMCFKKNL
ncbi:MAG: GNAT family N-acetyltransferase [Bacteroidota bacterium]|nr:GNAT family N-acetyltransferase [Bacteroidota bacterium]